MLNTAELKLLKSNTSQFPMINAASAALAECGKCRHPNVNVRMLLGTAIAVYRTDPKFIEHCRKLFPLPCVLGGLLVG